MTQSHPWGLYSDIYYEQLKSIQILIPLNQMRGIKSVFASFPNQPSTLSKGITLYPSL